MQVFINGLITGFTISVLALAFTAVYLPTRVFHIALGGIYAAVPFVAWQFIQWGWPWYVAVLMALSAGIALSLGCELINHAPLERKRASSAVHLISSLGIYIIIAQAAAMIWGNNIHLLSREEERVVRTGDLVITDVQVIAAVVSVALLVFFYLWLRRSGLGLKFRALADNPTEFALRGHSVRYFRLLAFGLSGFLCAVSALLVAYDTGFDAHTGLPAILLAIVAVIMGGREFFLGPVLGGILLGIVRSEVIWFLSAKWQDAATFLLLALFLFLRPSGILGRKLRAEAQV